MPNGNNHDVLQCFPSIVDGVLVWQELHNETIVLDHYHHLVMRFDKFFRYPRYEYQSLYDGSGAERDHTYETLLLNMNDFIESFRLVQLVWAEKKNTFFNDQWSLTLHGHTPEPGLSTDYNLDDVYDKNSRNYGFLLTLIEGGSLPLYDLGARDYRVGTYLGINIAEVAPDIIRHFDFVVGHYAGVSLNMRGAGGDQCYLQMYAIPTFKKDALEALFVKEAKLGGRK